MAYHLGVDLGTTFTGAALARDGRAEPVTLGTSSVAVPSVVYQSADELVVGQPAVRRAASEPSRVAREFKRRVGDPTPLVLGGTPVPAELLMARVLGWVVDQVTATEGSPPTSLAVTHPANWGEYKLDLLRQATRHVGLQVDHLVPEPVAAATFYASQRELAPGSVVAVYDLGGGTFDAALVRADETGFQILGRPDGIERLGGIDFDHVVFRHVTEAVGIDVDEADADDPGTAAALAQLRHECVEAKEALSTETDASIPVMLPDRHTEVRLTRTEFEAMIGPALDETVVALRRAIASAQIGPEQVAAVLLVGGSSRIPLVSQRVTAALNRPVAVDARPKDAVPLGAALAASAAASAPPVTQPMAAPPPTPTAPLPSPTPMDPTAAAQPQPAPTPRVGTRRAWWVAAAAALVAVVAIAALLASNDGSGNPQAGPTTTTAESNDPTEPIDNPTTSSTSSTGNPGSDLPMDLGGGELDALLEIFGGEWEPADEPLPGDDWNDDARADWIDGCVDDNAPWPQDKTKDEACGCVYDEISISGIDFDDFNETYTSEEEPGLSDPSTQAIYAGMSDCGFGLI